MVCARVGAQFVASPVSTRRSKMALVAVVSGVGHGESRTSRADATSSDGEHERVHVRVHLHYGRRNQA